MKAGIGVDVVDIARFERALTRVPSLEPKLFTGEELGLPTRSLAARFAAKEALAKALGSPGTLHWHDAEVRRSPSGQPRFHLTGTVKTRLTELGITEVELSLSHDGGVALAMVLAHD